MRGFLYHRPANLPGALALLGANAEARPMAGGMSLLPVLKLHLAAPEALVDLTDIPALDGIAVADGVLTIGAMARHASVARSDVVRGVIPALAALAGGIGDPQVRNRGTLGGSLANADPAADYPAGVLALGATIVTDRREIAADAFFTGLFATALQPGELITAVRFPVPLRAGYATQRNPASRYAIAGVFVAQFADGTRVAVTGAGPCAFRVPEMEAALAADFAPAVLSGITVSEAGLNADLHAEAAYRAHLIGVLARRAVAGS